MSDTTNPLNQMPNGPIDVYFATNRAFRGTRANAELIDEFSQQGPQDVRYGYARVKPPDKWESDKFEVQRIRIAREKLTGETKVFGSAQIFESLRQRMANEETDTVVLLHGFAADAKVALARAAEVKLRYQWDLAKPLNVFVFSWPARDRMIPLVSYFNQREVSKLSGLAIARSFLQLRDWLNAIGRENQCRQRLHLVAHSMGNWALRHAVQGIRDTLGDDHLERVFDNIFLMASDVDDDAFEKDHKFGVLPNLARAVHVYYATDDLALVVSDATKLNPDRLGSQGPRYKDGLHRKISLIDCSDVSYTKLVHQNHQYYRQRPEVYADIRQILAQRIPRTFDGRVYMPDERAYRIIPFDEREEN